MVNPQSCVSLESAAPIFPEGVDGVMRMEMANRVRPSLVEQALVGGLHLGCEEGVVTPSLRRIDVHVRRHDVEISGDDDWCIEVDQGPHMVVEPLEPAQLEIELGARTGIAVGKIETRDQ
ncbi:hypothetical protein D3C86_1046260 [compost metagenome]